MVPEKSRIKNLSTQYRVFYKWSVSIFLAGLVLGFFYDGLISFQEDGRPSHLLFPLSYSYSIYLWFWVNRHVFRVEFDQDFMYITQKDQDLIIPLENIKDVNLISMGGVYRVELYAKELFGDKFYFKPSLLYPFNHKKKEALVDILWANIEKAKTKKQDFQRNALHS